MKTAAYDSLPRPHSRPLAHPPSPMAAPPLPAFPLPRKPLLRSTTLLHSTSGRPTAPISFPFRRFPARIPTPQHTTPQPDDLPPVGDCLVFEEDAFEDRHLPVIKTSPSEPAEERFVPKKSRRRIPTRKASPSRPAAENLVPEKWHEDAAKLKIEKKERRKMLRELKFGSKILKKKEIDPAAVLKSPEYLEFRKKKFSELRPVVLDNPRKLPEAPPPTEEARETEAAREPGGRVEPRNPRSEIRGVSLESIRNYLSSGDYVPVGGGEDDKKPGGSKKLFTKEDKVLLNKRVPNIAVATSNKWLPLHALAASGEFYLMDEWLKHDANINAVDVEGLSALHKAIMGKKHAIVNYLLRESANPFIRDKDGATLMHYAVQAASILSIKTLLLYNVDINLPDDDGWTPLHLAVQAQRTDILKLLLVKGANKTLRNKDGLTPIDLCLHFGKSERTYEIIKLLKEQPRTRQLSF